MRLLALSPHLDDVAFSCGGAVAALAARGWECVVATVFTASVADPQGFALACQTDKGLGPEVDYMALRREEDRRFGAIAGARVRHLGLPEAPHRGYGSADELFGPAHEEDGLEGRLRARLVELFAQEHPDLVLVPQGVGGHVDHRLVRRAIAAAPPPAPVLAYRELPYGLREPSDPGPGELALVPDAPAVARKLDGAAAYASQLAFQFGGEAAMRDALGAAARDGGERFGMPRARGRAAGLRTVVCRDAQTATSRPA